MRQEDTFRKGRNYIEMLLLNILIDGDYYGHELVELVRKYSEGKLALPESSLYPALYRLVSDGYITSTEVPCSECSQRLSYHIEPKGKRHLAKLIIDYENLKDAIDKVLCREITNPGEYINEQAKEENERSS